MKRMKGSSSVSFCVVTTGLVCASVLMVPGRGVADPVKVKWEDPVQVASGGGYQGPWQMNRSVYNYVDDPTVTVSEDGSVAVAWIDQMRKDIFFQRFSKEGKVRFAEPVNVSKTPDVFSWLPRMVMTSGNTPQIYILWQEIIFSGGSHGGDILFSRSEDGGRTFLEPVNLSRDKAGSGKGRLGPDYWHNGSLDLVMDPDGHLHAAWTEYEGALWYRRSKDGGRSFSPALHVSGSDQRPARAPSLAAGPSNTVYLAWASGGNPEADIRYAKSQDGGASFGEPRIVAQTRGHSDVPKTAVDSSGALHMVYAESPSGPLEHYHIEYTRLPAGAGSFTVPRKISDPQSGRYRSVNFPSMSIGEADSLCVVWELFPEGTHRPYGLGFTFSGNGGNRFATPSVIPGSGEETPGFNGSLQGLLMRKLAVNRSGAIAVVNSTFLENEASSIWLFQGRISAGNG